MKKLELELPDLVGDVEEQKEKLIKEFRDQVIIPFNKFFEDYTVKDSSDHIHNLCELTQELCEFWEGEIAWGQVFSPFDISDIENGSPEVAVKFFFDGTAEIRYEGVYSKETGTWEEILVKMIKEVKVHLESLHDVTRVQKLGKILR